MGTKSLVLLYEFEDVFTELESDEERSQLIMAIFAYKKRGEEPEFSGLLRFAWRTHIKPKLDEMSANYQAKCEKLRANVNKRWKKNTDDNEDIQKNTNVSEPIQNGTNVDDKDKDKDKDIYKPSNIQTTSCKDIGTYPQQPVDNSVGNAEPEAKKRKPATLDGMDLYLLESPAAFNLFRSEYPRKQGALRDVQTAWVVAVAGGAAPGDLVMAARKYASQCKKEKTEPKYIAMPQNFLKDKWRAYIPEYSPGCPHCHGQGVYEKDGGMILCDCNRRYG